MTNFDKLINFVLSCGGKHLDEFVRQAAKNASYTSSDAVTVFLEALGIWVESLVSRLLDAQHFSLIKTLYRFSVFLIQRSCQNHLMTVV